MTKVKVTWKTLKLIEEHAIGRFNNTAVKQPDGTYLMDVDDDVLAYITTNQKPGEDIDDTIRRLMIEKTCH